MNHPQSAGGKPAPSHHPSPETLATYAAGTIRAGFDLVVAAHVKVCPTCRAEVSRLETVGAHVMSDIDPVAMAESALAATLARLDAPVPASPPSRELGDILSQARQRWVAPGVWTARVATPHNSGDRIYLLRVAPGAHTARHSHSGAEFTMVLEGALNDNGTIYRAGDFIELGAEHTHRPLVHGDTACLCLFATEGRLVPKDLVGRIAFALANV